MAKKPKKPRRPFIPENDDEILDILIRRNKARSPGAAWRNLPSQEQIKLPKKRGRKTGAGRIQDDKHIEEMRKMILDEDAKSPHEAANFVAPKVKNKRNADLSSIVRRLTNKYKEAFGD